MVIRIVLLIILAVVMPHGAAAQTEEARGVAPYSPQPADCQVAPLPEDAFAAAQQEAQILQATPRASIGEAEGQHPLQAEQLSAADLPAGTPADAETVAAITRVEEEYAACFNAGELRRAASLTTGEVQPVIASLAISFGGGTASATPVPPPEDFRIPSVVVTGVRVLPDGRIGAVVTWGTEQNFHLYEQIDGRWRIADEISVYDSP
ncbi:MAG: hypothetical protein IT338_11325 [Thermomicrobiales bacterium]|nr:hypothetical protein [Thermomicrobiales bacterium]